MIVKEENNKVLNFVFMKRYQLKDRDITRMYELMEQSYNHIKYELFVRDLDDKNYVGVLYDNNQTIQGFTTFAINPKETGTEDYSILFSGDTIIDRNHWGTQELIRGWGSSVGKIIASNPGKTWYWFLLSKGHRTYMYLPLFFNEYYPSTNNTSNEALLSILEKTAIKLYADLYKPETGTIVFDHKSGELKPDLAKSTYEKQQKPHVKLFLERNPGFYNGDELVCITELHPDNMKGYGKKYLLEGMGQNLGN